MVFKRSTELDSLIPVGSKCKHSHIHTHMLMALLSAWRGRDGIKVNGVFSVWFVMVGCSADDEHRILLVRLLLLHKRGRRRYLKRG